jgi:hypothetical protein
VLTLDISEFRFELDDGSIKNVGAPTKEATAKLYDVAEASAREFGDSRVKFAFADDDGNEIEVALPPETAREIAADVEALAEESRVFE